MPKQRVQRPTILTPEDAKFPLVAGIRLLKETRRVLWHTMMRPGDESLYENLGEILEKLERANQSLAEWIKSQSK